MKYKDIQQAPDIDPDLMHLTVPKNKSTDKLDVTKSVKQIVEDEPEEIKEYRRLYKRAIDKARLKGLTKR